MILRLVGTAAAALLLASATATANDAHSPLGPLLAQKSGGPDLYFLSVGAQNYAHAGDMGLHEVRGAAYTAQKIADLAHRNGARYGIVLTSNGTHFVGKEDILNALADLKAQIWTDRPSHPVVLFYYMGHGVGDATYLNLFLPPGNVILVTEPTQSMQTQEMAGLIWSDDILVKLQFMNERLSAWDEIVPSEIITSKDRMRLIQAVTLDLVQAFMKGTPSLPGANGAPAVVPYVAIFDNCYSGIKTDLVDADKPLNQTHDAEDLGSRISQFSQSVSVYARAFLKDQLRDLLKDGLVVYAAKPGSEALPVGDPTADAGTGDSYAVGPIAARMLIAIPTLHGTITFDELARAVDPGSGVALSGTQPYLFRGTGSLIQNTALFGASDTTRLSPHGVVRHETGSEIAIQYCCGWRASDFQRTPKTPISFRKDDRLTSFRASLTGISARNWIYKQIYSFMGSDNRCTQGYILRFFATGNLEVKECVGGHVTSRITSWSLRGNGPLDPILHYDDMDYELRFEPPGQDSFMHLLTKGVGATEPNASRKFRREQD